jgi:hypothetical protein
MADKDNQDKNDDLVEALETESASVQTANRDSDYAIKSFQDIVTELVSEQQFNVLLGRTPAKYIKVRPGKGGKNFSYVPHGYVTAVLNKAFGFDWDFEIIPQVDGAVYSYLAAEPEQSRPASIIVHGRLTIRLHYNPDDMSQITTITKTSTGEKEVIKGMSWGGMIKSAESDAFKKAASRLGVALDLYWADADEDYIPAEELNEAQKTMLPKFKELFAEQPDEPFFRYRDLLVEGGYPNTTMDDIVVMAKKVKNGSA